VSAAAYGKFNVHLRECKNLEYVWELNRVSFEQGCLPTRVSIKRALTVVMSVRNLNGT